MGLEGTEPPAAGDDVQMGFEAFVAENWDTFGDNALPPQPQDSPQTVARTAPDASTAVDAVDGKDGKADVVAAPISIAGSVSDIRGLPSTLSVPFSEFNDGKEAVASEGVPSVRCVVLDVWGYFVLSFESVVTNGVWCSVGRSGFLRLWTVLRPLASLVQLIMQLRTLTVIMTRTCPKGRLEFVCPSRRSGAGLGECQAVPVVVRRQSHLLEAEWQKLRRYPDLA